MALLSNLFTCLNAFFFFFFLLSKIMNYFFTEKLQRLNKMFSLRLLACNHTVVWIELRLLPIKSTVHLFAPAHQRSMCKNT